MLVDCELQLRCVPWALFFSRQITAGNKPAMVEFYAPWCHHCKKLKTPYAEAAEELVGEAVFAAFDATADRELAEKYGVNGYPTLLWFSGGEHQKYEGPRTRVGLVNFVKKRVQSSAGIAIIVHDMIKV